MTELTRYGHGRHWLQTKLRNQEVAANFLDCAIDRSIAHSVTRLLLIDWVVRHNIARIQQASGYSRVDTLDWARLSFFKKTITILLIKPPETIFLVRKSNYSSTITTIDRSRSCSSTYVRTNERLNEGLIISKIINCTLHLASLSLSLVHSSFFLSFFIKITLLLDLGEFILYKLILFRFVLAFHWFESLISWAIYLLLIF